MCRFHLIQGGIYILRGEDTLIVAKQQNSKRPPNTKPHCPGDSPAGVFLHEQDIRLNVVSIYDGFALTQVEAGCTAEDIHRLALPNGNYLYEGAGANQLRLLRISRIAGEFGVDRLRYPYFSVQFPQQVQLRRLHKGDQRPGIGDDDHEFALSKLRISASSSSNSATDWCR